MEKNIPPLFELNIEIIKFINGLNQSKKANNNNLFDNNFCLEFPEKTYLSKGKNIDIMITGYNSGSCKIDPESFESLAELNKIIYGRDGEKLLLWNKQNYFNSENSSNFIDYFLNSKFIKEYAEKNLRQDFFANIYKNRDLYLKEWENSYSMDDNLYTRKCNTFTDDNKYYWTNFIKIFSKGIKNSFLNNLSKNHESIFNKFKKFYLKEIELLKPKIILLVGNWYLKNLEKIFDDSLIEIKHNFTVDKEESNRGDQMPKIYKFKSEIIISSVNHFSNSWTPSDKYLNNLYKIMQK